MFKKYFFFKFFIPNIICKMLLDEVIFQIEILKIVKAVVSILLLAISPASLHPNSNVKQKCHGTLVLVKCVRNPF